MAQEEAKPTITTQELFDTVATHLLTQRIPSIIDLLGMRYAAGSTRPYGPTCLYRGPNGLKCAVGCLIPDEKYNPEFDSGDYGTREVIRDGVPYDLTEDQIRMLMALQVLHDRTRPNEWPKSLTRLARFYDINSDCVERFATES